MNFTRIGIDLAKSVFQVHGLKADGTVVRRRLSRGQFRRFIKELEPTLVGMEACGSAHYWGRELQSLGHEVRLMAPQFVAAYRKSGKNDGNDAEAVCEAMSRPTMRFVPVKTLEQQSVLVVHRARELAKSHRKAVANQVRGLLAEYGIVFPRGIEQVRRRLPEVLEDAENGVLEPAREAFAELYECLVELDARVAEYDRRITRLARESQPAQRLMQLPGVGPLSATALVASAGDARHFSNGRQFAAWLGLVPRQHSSGDKTRLGGITKRGDRYLRTLLVHGARSVLTRAARRDDPRSRWAVALRERRGFNKAVVALAAKHARSAWVMLAREEDYRLSEASPS